MPVSPTNQGNNGSQGGGIDGFFFLTNTKAPAPVSFKINKAAIPYYEHNKADYALKLATFSQEGGFRSREPGKTIPGPLGTSRDYWYRLSDHAPVVQNVTVSGTISGSKCVIA